MAQDDGDPAGGSWHLDKRVPVALILAIALQSFTAIWWAGRIDSRVDSIERRQEQQAPQGDRIVRLETRMENIAEYILEIRNLLRQREARP